MRPLILVLTTAALAVVIALPQTALAACTITTSTPTQTITTEGHTFYIVVLGCDAGKICPFAEFVYEEGNNIPGLQRHDAQHDDTCGDGGMSDYQHW